MFTKSGFNVHRAGDVVSVSVRFCASVGRQHYTKNRFAPNLDGGRISHRETCGVDPDETDPGFS